MKLPSLEGLSHLFSGSLHVTAAVESTPFTILWILPVFFSVTRISFGATNAMAVGPFSPLATSSTLRCVSLTVGPLADAIILAEAGTRSAVDIKKQVTNITINKQGFI